MKTYSDMKRDYENTDLGTKGIKLPAEKTQRGQALLYLYQHMGQVVSKSAAERVVAKRLNQQPKDLQSLRHLGKQSGYNILQAGANYRGQKLKRGEYVLVDLRNSNSYFDVRRRTEYNLDFSSIKLKYDNCCATCGSEEGEIHRYDNVVTMLEKGHKDPKRTMDNSNIIPQCQICNKVAKDSWVFDDYGRVAKVTVQGLLNEHSRAQKEKFLLALKADLS